MSEEKDRKQLYLQIGLFILTLLTTTLSGAEWMTGRQLFYTEESINWGDFLNGFSFSIPFLLILTVHEFGHYFTAQYHKVKVTLPYYIPMWFGFIGGPSIGTMGAFIKIKERVDSRKKYFDIGVAGPLAGFVIAFLVIWYGFTHLPPLEYLFQIHPEYAEWGANYDKYAFEDGMMVVILGPNLLFHFFETYVVNDPSLIPHAYEVIHYPYLLAGYLACFFTALNLLPIGQLDGGHILYGLIGPKKHKVFSKVFFLGLIYYAGLGLISPFEVSPWMTNEVLYVGFVFVCLHRFSESARDRLMYALGVFSLQLVTVYFFPTVQGYPGWLVFSFLLGRVIGIYHPPVLIDQPLDIKRKILGWLAIVVFVLCFSPKPFNIVEIQSKESMSETPSMRSLMNPSPYLHLMDMPYSLPRASNNSMNSGVEMSVLEASPVGSKN